MSFAETAQRKIMDKKPMNERILVVDDEALILSVVKRALEKRGYRVTAASSAKGLLKALKAESFDLFILDMYLTGAKPGELIRIVRESTEKPRILVISGSPKDCPEEHFIQKPFQIDALRAKVGELLDGP